MAVENGVQNAELGYLLFPFEQYSNLAGKPLVGGHMEIYEAGTDTKYISYNNWDGAENTFRIPIPNDGRITVLADPTKTFDCYLYDSYNNLVCSRLNVQANVPGNISISGADTRINNTDGTLDVSLRTLGNNVRQYTINTHNKVLDVQDPLYFVENSNTATVIGFSGDSSGSSSGKMDESKLEYNAYGEISAYNGSAFASQGGGGAGDPEVNVLVHSNSATWNNVSAKLDTTAFSTVSGNFLTAIPDDYSTKDYVQSSVSSKLDSTAFSTVSGSFLTAHQDLSDYATTAELADKLDTSAFSDVSSTFLTSHQSLNGYLTKVSADTLYQPIGDYADATALDGKVDTSTFTAFSTTTNEKIEYISGALSGTYELSAGEGIDITDYPNEQKTVISVTGKLDTTAFSDVSGSFLTAHQSLDGYLQDVQHDNTLSGNGTSASPLGVVPGYNETVLWSGNYTGTRTQTFNLSESYLNFDQLEIWWGNQVGSPTRGVVITRYPNDSYQNAWQGINACSDSTAHLAYKMCFLSANSNTQFTAYNYRQAMINTAATGNFVWSTAKQYYECYPVKIIGINRKQ